MIDGVRAVLLQVPDVSLASVWYARALEAQPFESQPGTYTFQLGATRLVLRSVSAGAPDSEFPPAGVPANPALAAPRLFFLSSDALDADLRRVISLGAVLLEPPTPQDPTVAWAVLRDPFGNVFGLMEVRDANEAREAYQRVSEKLALRHIRATLDDLQAEEQQRRTLRRLLPAIGLVAIVALVWLLADVVQRRQAAEIDTLRPTLPLRAASSR